MISTVVYLNLLLSSQGRLIDMDSRENSRPNIAIEQQQTDKTAYTHTTPLTPSENLHPQKSSGGLKHTSSQNESDSESLSLKKTSGTQKLTGTQQTSRQKLEPKPASYEPSAKSSTGKWIAGIVIGAVVAVGAWLGYDVYIRPSQKGNIGSEPATVSPEVTSKPDYGKFAEEILSSLENDYGGYVKAGAIEDYGFCENEEELSQAWRGRNVFMFTGSNAGFIDEWKFSESFTNALKPSTLEMNDEGTLFNADMSDAQSFRANSLIESAVTLAGSLRPDESNMFANIQAMKRNITGDIMRQLETNGTHGYVRFILGTNNSGAKLMAAYSLDPYSASARKYLVLSDGFTGFDGRTLRDIEDSININAVSFTMRRGRVESHDSLSECLKKFVHSFAK